MATKRTLHKHLQSGAPDGSSTSAGLENAPTDRPAPPVTDPQQVWSNLISTPQGQRLTDPRIHSLSPARFDTVFLDTLKSAFLAGWAAAKEVES